ncbi:MAG: hypothetical protein R3D71_08580 [Rickettsiales bacterium]
MSISYEEWVEKIFNPLVEGQYYYWDDNRTYSDIDDIISSVDKIEYLIRLFEHSEDELSMFSDKQVSKGLWYIAGNSEYTEVWKDDKINERQKKQFIESIYKLFVGCFVNRCERCLGHLDEKGTNPVNSICYMWWDILPIISSKKTDDYLLFLDIMKKILSINHVACQESALHGLGHWHNSHPEIVEDIIDNYLARFGNLFTQKKGKRVLKDPKQELPKILRYALQARTGCVQ